MCLLAWRYIVQELALSWAAGDRSEGTMVPSLRDPDLFPKEAIARAVGKRAAEGALPCHQKFYCELTTEKE